jgi:hypothetical protein
MVTDNTCLIVQVYFFQKINVPHRDHSEVCPRLMSQQEIRGNSTRRHRRSVGVILRDAIEIVESTASYCEVM